MKFAIFGGILPAAFFKTVRCQADGSEIHHPQQDPGYRCELFVAGWLGWGFSIVRTSTVRYATQAEVEAFQEELRAGPRYPKG